MSLFESLLRDGYVLQFYDHKDLYGNVAEENKVTVIELKFIGELFVLLQSNWRHSKVLIKEETSSFKKILISFTEALVCAGHTLISTFRGTGGERIEYLSGPYALEFMIIKQDLGGDTSAVCWLSIKDNKGTLVDYLDGDKRVSCSMRDFESVAEEALSLKTYLILSAFWCTLLAAMRQLAIR